MAPPSRTTIAPASAAPIVTPARTANSGPPTSARARAGSQRRDDGPTGADDVRGIDPEMRMASEEWSRDLCPGSLDSRHSSAPRRCSFRGVVDVNPDPLAVRVAIDPTADGPGFGVPRALDELILQPALLGLTVVPVNRFPRFVHITAPIHGTDRVTSDAVIGECRFWVWRGANCTGPSRTRNGTGSDPWDSSTGGPAGDVTSGHAPVHRCHDRASAMPAQDSGGAGRDRRPEDPWDGAVNNLRVTPPGRHGRVPRPGCAGAVGGRPPFTSAGLREPSVRHPDDRRGEPLLARAGPGARRPCGRRTGAPLGWGAPVRRSRISPSRLPAPRRRPAGPRSGAARRGPGR